jgi:hypothetical protein
MITASSRLLATAVVLSAALSAQALTINEGNLTVRTAAVPAGNSACLFDLKADALAIDHGYAHWWFYRLAGDTQEFALNDSGPVTGGVPPFNTHADRDFADVGSRGLLRANVDMDIYSAGPASGVLTSRVTFTNLSAVPQTLDLFCYSDLDVAGSSGDDSATGDGQHHVVTDASGVRIEIRAAGADHSQVGVYPSVLNSLTDAALNDLNDTLPPFSGDYTGAFQWQARTLQPGEQRSFTVVFAVDTAANVVPQVEHYGVGSSLVPEIYTDTLPLQDNANPRQIGIHLKNALPNAPVGLLSSTSSAPGVAFLGVTLWVDPNPPAQFPIGMTTATGEAAVVFAIPASPYLTGFPIFHQYFYVDYNSANGLAQFTPGLMTTVGRL